MFELSDQVPAQIAELVNWTMGRGRGAYGHETIVSFRPSLFRLLSLDGTNEP